MVRCRSKNRHQKERDWTTWSKFVDHTSLTGPHNWGGPIWQVNELKNLLFNKIFIWAPKLISKRLQIGTGNRLALIAYYAS